MLTARTKRFASLLQNQFFNGEVEKTYLAKILGHPKEDEFRCDLRISEDTVGVGARTACENGKEALTIFKVLRRNADGTSLVEAKPITGRTNQIRIHLWELGFPIVGDPLYLPDRKLGTIQTGTPDDSPLCLHAKGIAFHHPVTKAYMRFEGSNPNWAA